MEVPSLERLLRWTLMAALGVLLVLFSIVGHRNFKEYSQFREKEILLEERVAAERAEFERQKKYYDRLMNDPFFLEAVVRDRLGYVREDELVFRFEEEPAE